VLWAGAGWWLGRNQDELRNKIERRKPTDDPSAQTASAPAYAGNRRVGNIGSDGAPVVR